MLAIGHPHSPQEFDEYFELRWRLLREPWQQPRGSECDEFEDAALHVSAREDGQLVGVGRLHFPDASTARIRYLATIAHRRGNGVGTAIVERLERLAREGGAARIVLVARKTAAGFYAKLGYIVTGEGPTIFGDIEHVQMVKPLGAAPSAQRP